MEGYTQNNCFDCDWGGWQTKDRCFQCTNCGWIVYDTGFSQCVPGDQSGPIFDSERVRQYWHNNKQIWYRGT